MIKPAHIGDATLYCGEAAPILLANFAENSIDAVVTDPPYGLGEHPDIFGVLRCWLNGEDYQPKGKGFMGKDWDSFVLQPSTWAEVYRVLKPGGHLLSFAGSRTYDLMCMAIRFAGFEIRDQIDWLYGSGFPKSKNLRGDLEGLGTALKPAHEPIVLARKPLAGTVEGNVRRWGTGALNIDRCRITVVGEQISVGFRTPLMHEGWKREWMDDPERWEAYKAAAVDRANQKGRWPANVIHDGSDEVVSAFPEAKGQQAALTGDEPSGKMGAANCYGRMDRRHAAVPRLEAETSAARFFYCAKATKAERNAGLEHFPDRPGGMVSNTSGQHITRRDGGAPGPTKNNHPTVKPIALMEYLCRLITPPGGTVLDLCMGSGSTGCAALGEGFKFVGIEKDSANFEIACGRVSSVKIQRKLFA